MPNELTVNREEFVKAFKKLRALEGRTRLPKVHLSFDGEDMIISYSELAQIAIPAAGSWNGTAIIPRTTLTKFLKILPETSQVTLKADDSKLRVGSMALSCEWVS